MRAQQDGLPFTIPATGLWRARRVWGRRPSAVNLATGKPLRGTQLGEVSTSCTAPDPLAGRARRRAANRRARASRRRNRR